MKIELKRISVVGLGKLGLPLAACFAAKGFSTIGLDVDSRKVEAVNQGACPIYEPGLQELLSSARNCLTATDSYEKAVMGSDVTFIMVPTPSDKQGNFSLQYVFESACRIGDAIGKKSDYHLVVLTSTVIPGATEGELKPLLEGRSKKHCGKEFGLCYNPEFVALGSVIHDLLNPDFILIGESDSLSGSVLADLYKHICENNPPVARMNFINAELTKLALNTYVTTKITFANMLACICEHSPGADVEVVTSALGLDSRIGSRYLKGAIGYGGPCFPRDNLALAAFARSVGASAPLAEITDIFNRQQVERLKKIIKSYLLPDGKVGILGLAYKANSDVIEESQGILLAQLLASDGVRVIVYDPVAMENAKQLLGESVTFMESAEECIHKSDIIVVTTAWKEFKELSPAEFVRPNQPRILVDCWRILDKMEQQEGIVYLPIGVGRPNKR